MRVFTLTGACLFLFLCPPAHGQTSSKAPCVAILKRPLRTKTT